METEKPIIVEMRAVKNPVTIEFLRDGRNDGLVIVQRNFFVVKPWFRGKKAFTETIRKGSMKQTKTVRTKKAKRSFSNGEVSLRLFSSGWRTESSLSRLPAFSRAAKANTATAAVRVSTVAIITALFPKSKFFAA